MISGKICAHCGKDLPPGPKYKRKVYCDVDCMRAAYKARFAGDLNPNYRGRWRPCLTCGEPIPSFDSTRKYCSRACYLAGRKQFQPAPFQARPNRVKPTEPNQTCRACGKVFYTRRPVRTVTCSKVCQRIWRSVQNRGDRSHFWQGGKTEDARRLRNSGEYGQWRVSVFERDNYTCQMCRKRGLKKLAAHHIKPFHLHRELSLVLANGITLCWTCHASIRWKESHYEKQFFAITGGVDASPDVSDE